MAISVAVALSAGSAATFEAASILRPIAVNLGVLALGCAFGYAAKLFLARKFSSDNRLIIAIALLFAFCGVCAALDVSPLLGCMSMGTVYINATEDDKLFKQLNYFSPPLLLLFFVRSGMAFQLDALFGSSASAAGVPLLAVGVLYFITRIAGKYAGAFLAAWPCASARACATIWALR